MKIVAINSVNFSNLFTTDDGELPTMPDINIINQLDALIFNIDDALKMINNLSNSKSCEPDNLSSHFIKNVAQAIASPLTLLFQRSLNEQHLPQIWKMAYTIPLYKGKGNKFDVYIIIGL